MEDELQLFPLMNTNTPLLEQASARPNRPVALVVGASGGIGSCVVTSLLAQGWEVIAVARHRERLEATLSHLQEDSKPILKIPTTDHRASLEDAKYLSSKNPKSEQSDSLQDNGQEAFDAQQGNVQELDGAHTEATPSCTAVGDCESRLSQRLKICTLDACDSNAVASFFDSILTEFGSLDAMVNCAGSILIKPAHLISDEEFEETLALNLRTAFYLLRRSVRLMMKQPQGGSIVLCSSVAAQRGLVNHEAIAAAKAGIEGLALAAAATYAPYHIRVNCVAPGLVRTSLTQKFTENEAILKKSAAIHPLGRIGEPAEVASAITWFLDPLQSWVTGQVLGIDGGLGKIQALIRG